VRNVSWKLNRLQHRQNEHHHHYPWHAIDLSLICHRHQGLIRGMTMSLTRTSQTAINERRRHQRKVFVWNSMNWNALSHFFPKKFVWVTQVFVKKV
jgi:hypothetical protein